MVEEKHLLNKLRHLVLLHPLNLLTSNRPAMLHRHHHMRPLNKLLHPTVHHLAKLLRLMAPLGRLLRLTDNRLTNLTIHTALRSSHMASRMTNRLRMASLPVNSPRTANHLDSSLPMELPRAITLVVRRHLRRSDNPRVHPSALPDGMLSMIKALSVGTT